GVVGRGALARCQAEVRQRLRRFDEELTHLRRGYYAPAVRAASLLFNQAPVVHAALAGSTEIQQPLSVLVVLEPAPAPGPHPEVAGGRLLAAHWTLTDADRSALEMALRLRDVAAAPVTLHAVAVGPRGVIPVLREVLGYGIDRVRLVVAEAEALTPDSAA